jgi:arginase
MDRPIRIIRNESEITAGTRGASLGPAAIDVAAWKKGNCAWNTLKRTTIPNVNFMLCQPVKYPFAKRIEGLIEVFGFLVDELKHTIEQGEFPLIIAGDHGSAGGTIAGLTKAYPDKRIGVVWIDAHGDLHTPYTTPSGNMHGMPLATALGVDNLDCKINNPASDVVGFWNQIKAFGGKEVKIQPEDLVFVAVRDTEEAEDALMDRLAIRNITVGEVNQLGAAAVVAEISRRLAHCDLIYVSFDVDSMDPQLVSHGTGTPVPNGLTPDQAKEIMMGLLQTQKVCCLEVVEVNPCLDEKQNKMAETTLELIESLIPYIQ